MTSGSEHEAWVISAAGEQTARRFEAPVEIPGWTMRPWVTLRPLSAREALRRESIGLCEEYDLTADGTARMLRRTWDLEAMMEYELECCLLDCVLPMHDEEGAIRELRWSEADASSGELLDRLPPRLMAWVNDCLEAVNMRRAPDEELVAEAKKA